MKVSKLQVSKNFFLSIGMSYLCFSLVGVIFFYVTGMDRPPDYTRDTVSGIVLTIAYLVPYIVHRLIPSEITYSHFKMKSYSVVYLSLILFILPVSILNLGVYHNILESIYNTALITPGIPYIMVASLFN